MLKKTLTLILLIATLSLTACGGGAGGSGSDGLAVVYEVQLMTLESFPLQIQATVRGNFPDACTQLGEVSQSFDQKNKMLRVRIPATRPADAVCAQMLSPFETTVPLEVYGLPAGTYTVDVNGVFVQFTLAQDNILPSP
jgi:inhibitor of cysteine peptidase